MTLIIGWIACDQDGPCSAYMASDSRFSNGNQKFDYAQKLFALNNTPDIFGFCGDVLFSRTILPGLVTICDQNRLVNKLHTSEERSNIIFNYISNQYSKYGFGIAPVKIYHISRDHDKSFKSFEYSCNQNNIWKKDIITSSTNKSHIVFVDGSGAKEYNDMLSYYQAGNNVDTSRNYFHCFCEVLSNIKDKFCGGSPQLVGLYDGEKFNGMYFGIINNATKYYLGNNVDLLTGFENIRWYNTNFEICDYTTLTKKKKATRQPPSKKATP